MSPEHKPHCSQEQIAEALDIARRWVVGGLDWRHLSDMPKLSRAVVSLEEQLEAQADLLRRLRQWDMLNPYYSGVSTKLREHTADAPYWRGEIDRVLSNPASVQNTGKERDK